MAVAPQRHLPYGRQEIDDDDVAAVVEALRSDWLTTGPRVDEFERALAEVAGAAEAVAVSNGTAALHAAYHALGIGPGDEVVLPPITFAATANAVLYVGATPVFADVDPDTLLLDPAAAAAAITKRTAAVVAVDYAGQPAEYGALRELCDRAGVLLVSDACHSIGGDLDGAPVGSLADASCFSFHPVKHVTTGEGGAVVTADPEIAARARRFRNHGIDSDHRSRAAAGAWFYEQVELGFNYRLSDLQCALGTSQLRRLPAWIERRRALAARYDELLTELDGVEPLAVRPGVGHAYHLYVVQVDGQRDAVFSALRADGIGANVHYVPVHLHPYYRERLGTRAGQFPVAENAYTRLLSLPLFPAMDDADVDRVVDALAAAL
ncbi:MAG TPA: UDP-4-amino-4,6-dideoxy-N-acetyl-beta-L-altrosamine transaminase [Gaiellaceae bacterium]|nr:UDP-4-amino-4,6-dideoxy-N-acetyl-beta-L-altrosamine transaminase [Gaiellaceae bacterium]